LYFTDFNPHNGKDFQTKAYKWQELTSDNKRKAFFDKYGIHWTEFAQLMYFDVVRCLVIDLMHNLLQGIVKNQWYSCWIKNNAFRPSTEKCRWELSSIHEFMDSMSLRLLFIAS
jgi:hypothetical protein